MSDTDIVANLRGYVALLNGWEAEINANLRGLDSRRLSHIIKTAADEIERLRSIVDGSDPAKAKVLASGLNFVHHHNCAICGSPVGYEIIDDQPYFNSSCDCPPSGYPFRLVTWTEVAEALARAEGSA